VEREDASGNNTNNLNLDCLSASNACPVAKDFGIGEDIVYGTY
jgi:hypothetical protein